MTRLALGSVALVALFVSAPVVSARQEASPVQAPPARQVLDAALTKAKAEHKNVFVHFSASWCGWCHKLEAFMKTDEGQLLQYGPTAEVFHAPNSLRVARAFSDPPMNLIAASASASLPQSV
mgnify:CR=1 FL=1